MSQTILVLGGSGFVGRHVCALLSQQGHHITVPTRRLPVRHLQMLPGVSVVQADVHDPAQLQQLVTGHDVVINLIAILHGTPDAFEHAHVRLSTELARVCQATGVTRLIHVSALGADVNGPSLYQRSKAHGERALLAASQTTPPQTAEAPTFGKPLRLTLLRPSVIFGKDDKFINLFASLQKIFPVVPLAGAHTRFQPVWVQDVAKALVHCVNHTNTQAHIFELCGPDILTLGELVQLAGRWVGHPRPVVPLPEMLGRWQAQLMEWAPGPTLMSRDNLDSMKTDNVASGNLPGLEALGVSPPQSIHNLFAAPRQHRTMT